MTSPQDSLDADQQTALEEDNTRGVIACAANLLDPTFVPATTVFQVMILRVLFKAAVELNYWFCPEMTHLHG